MVKLITQREKQIISKKIREVGLTQNESNILSKSIRPKLIEMSKIDANSLLNKLEYNQKARSIESRIKEIILENMGYVDSIIICGSAVQTNYKEYNDVDVIVATKRSIKKKKKTELIKKVEKAGKIENINLDVQIYTKNSIISQYSYNPSLIYQLKDSKIIYGKIIIPTKVKLTGLDLRMKLDWSEGLDNNSDGEEIYFAIRNAILVLMLMNKKIDNYELKNNTISLLGNDLIDKLRKNSVSKLEKKLTLSYLALMLNYLEKELKNPKWEKIEISNH
jgi:predicted nucleotidyltransferase